MGWDLQYEGRGFESQHLVLDGQVFTLICRKIHKRQKAGPFLNSWRCILQRLFRWCTMYVMMRILSKICISISYRENRFTPLIPDWKMTRPISGRQYSFPAFNAISWNVERKFKLLSLYEGILVKIMFLGHFAFDSPPYEVIYFQWENSFFISKPFIGISCYLLKQIVSF